MKRLGFSIIASVAIALARWIAPLANAAEATAEQWAVFETSFTSDRKYGNPFMEVQVDVTFQSGEQQWLVPAFWSGGDKWTVRFAPPVTGDFSYQPKCSDPANQTLTYHAPEHPRQAIKDNAAFDFDMVGIGHNGYQTAAQALEMMKSCLAQEPVRPALCGEACYEGHMQTNFQDMQRHLFWSFMLSGAAGHTYGAAGIWQASVEGDPGIDPVYDWTTWQEAMVYPGSAQLGIGKKLLGQYPWSRFEVHPEWAEAGCFAAGIPGEVRFIYQPRRGIYDWKGTLVKNLEPGVRYTAFYFDPATGRRFDQGIVESATGEYRTNRVPSPQDWVLVLVNEAKK